MSDDMLFVVVFGSLFGGIALLIVISKLVAALYTRYRPFEIRVNDQGEPYVVRRYRDGLTLHKYRHGDLIEQLVALRLEEQKHYDEWLEEQTELKRVREFARNLSRWVGP